MKVPQPSLLEGENVLLGSGHTVKASTSSGLLPPHFLDLLLHGCDD